MSKIQQNKTFSQEELKKRHANILNRYLKLWEYVKDFTNNCKKYKDEKYFYTLKGYIPAIKKSSIIFISLIAEPSKKEKPGDALIMVTTKTQGLIPPTHLSEYPIQQVFEFEEYIKNTLRILGNPVV
jgi:hypothetical protein